MVKSCKTMNFEIITQIWKCLLSPSFMYIIYNIIERISCPSLSANSNPDYAELWSKQQFWLLNSSKKNASHVGQKKKIPLVPSTWKLGCECLSTNTILSFTTTCLQEVSDVVYSFFKNFDRNVKFYQSTEKCPHRALHNLLTLGGRAKAHFCRCTFLLISISTDLCNKKVPHFTLHFFYISKGGRFFRKEWGQHISVVGGGWPSAENRVEYFKRPNFWVFLK